MTYTAQYLNAEQTAVSRSDMPGAFIPVSLDNRHWAEIVADGVTVQPYDPPAAPVSVPDTITKRQAITICRRWKWITGAEAEQWAAGNQFPAVIVDLLAKMTPDERTESVITLHAMRESDAHAWVEAWIDGVWRRYDPTAAVAPERVEAGLAASLGEGEPVPSLARGNSLWFNRLQLRWDALNYDWKRFVVDFDNQSQSSLWKKLGLDSPQAWQIALTIILFCGAWCWLTLSTGWQPREKEQAENRLWRRWCRKLGRAGLPKRDNEGPSDYCQRCKLAWPQQAEKLDLIFENLISLRYASPPEIEKTALLKQTQAAITALAPLGQPAPERQPTVTPTTTRKAASTMAGVNAEPGTNPA